MVLASPDLFIDPLYADKITDRIRNVMITGQIKECPRSSNGKMYRLEWKEPLPAGVERLWLRNHLVQSKGNKETLQQAMKAHTRIAIMQRARKRRHAGRKNIRLEMMPL
jgi:hypothetical protein